MLRRASFCVFAATAREAARPSNAHPMSKAEGCGDPDTDVVIVGAGPVGLALAIGTPVEWNREAVDVRLDAQGGTVEARSQSSDRTIVVRGGWIIGCDGARSRVRERLGVPFEGRPVPNLQILQIDATPRWRHP